MIKACGKNEDGSPFILLGLSHENLKRLKEGQPVLIHLSELGLEGEIAIFAGETEASMEADMKKRFHFSVPN